MLNLHLFVQTIQSSLCVEKREAEPEEKQENMELANLKTKQIPTLNVLQAKAVQPVGGFYKPKTEFALKMGKDFILRL